MFENSPESSGGEDRLKEDQAKFDLRRDKMHYQGYEGERTPVGLEVNKSLGIPQAYVGNAFLGPKFFLDELQVGMTASEVEDLAVSVRDESTSESDLISIPTLNEYISSFLNKKLAPKSDLTDDEIEQKIDLQTQSIMRLVSETKLADINSLIQDLKSKIEGFRDGVAEDKLVAARKLFKRILERAEQELSEEEKKQIAKKLDDDFNTRRNPAA